MYIRQAYNLGYAAFNTGCDICTHPYYTLNWNEILLCCIFGQNQRSCGKEQCTEVASALQYVMNLLVPEISTLGEVYFSISTSHVTDVKEENYQQFKVNVISVQLCIGFNILHFLVELYAVKHDHSVTKHTWMHPFHTAWTGKFSNWSQNSMLPPLYPYSYSQKCNLEHVVKCCVFVVHILLEIEEWPSVNLHYSQWGSLTSLITVFLRVFEILKKKKTKQNFSWDSHLIRIHVADTTCSLASGLPI